MAEQELITDGKNQTGLKIDFGVGAYLTKPEQKFFDQSLSIKLPIQLISTCCLPLKLLIHLICCNMVNTNNNKPIVKWYLELMEKFM